MLRLAHEPAPIDDGITVAEAARILGADPSTVRELVRIGQLEGWHVGKHATKKDGRVTPPRGVRVSRGSCLDYRERNRVGAPEAETAPPQRQKGKPRRPGAAHQEAVAYLRSIGVRV